MSDLGAADCSSPRALLPTPRFEWERVVRSVPMFSTTKLVAFVMATYADQDGSRVRPGVMVLARDAGVTDKTIKRELKKLRDHGLIERAKHGNRWANQADEYQLTLPEGVRFMPDLVLAKSLPTTSPGDTHVT